MKETDKNAEKKKEKIRTLSGKLLGCLGWEITGDFPDVKRSIMVFAPHTAHVDILYGKLGFNEVGVNYVFLSKKEMFFFPMNLVMKKLGSIAVRGVKGENAIYKVAEMLKQADELHVVVSPEGRIHKVQEWNRGFYHMARKAEVPIIVAALDYGKKQMGVKGIIHELEDYDRVVSQMNEMYKGVRGKKPEDFILEQ